MREQAVIPKTTDGVVLRVRDVGRANLLLVVLTREYGVVEAFANGAKNAKSKLVAVSQPLSYSRFIFNRRGEKHTVSSGEIIHSFFAVREDIAKLALSFYMAELMQTLAPKHGRADDDLRLMLNALHLLEKGLRDNELIKLVFEMRLLAQSGFMPDLVCCTGCRRYEDEVMYFYPRSGEIRCGNCRAHTLPQPEIPLFMGALTAMRHVIYTDFEKIFDFKLSGPSLEQARKACEAFVLEQTDKTYSSLDFYRSSAYSETGSAEQNEST